MRVLPPAMRREQGAECSEPAPVWVSERARFPEAGAKPAFARSGRRSPSERPRLARRSGRGGGQIAYGFYFDCGLNCLRLARLLLKLEIEDSSKNRTRWMPPGQPSKGLLRGYLRNQLEVLPDLDVTFFPPVVGDSAGFVKVLRTRIRFRNRSPERGLWLAPGRWQPALTSQELATRKLYSILFRLSSNPGARSGSPS